MKFALKTIKDIKEKDYVLIKSGIKQILHIQEVNQKIVCKLSDGSVIRCLPDNYIIGNIK